MHMFVFTRVWQFNNFQVTKKRSKAYFESLFKSDSPTCFEKFGTEFRDYIFLLWKLLHQLPTRNIVSCQHFLLQDPAVKSFNMSVYVILCLCLGKLKDFPDYFETVLIPSMISRDQGTVGQVEERTAERFALQSWDKRQSGSSGTRHQSLCRQTWRE